MNDNRTKECECGNPKHANAAGCLRCLALEQQRYAAKSMREQIIAAIERYDTVDVVDLRDALGLGVHDAARLSAHLSRLVKDGVIERIGPKYAGYYRVVGRRRAA